MEIRLAERALNRWGFSDEERAKIRELMLRCADEAQTIRDRLAVARVAGYLDELDRRRDRDEVRRSEDTGRQRMNALRSALSTPEGRAALLAHVEVAAGLPAPQSPSPPAEG